MLRLMAIRRGMSVLDLGGTPSIWADEELPDLEITILNLPEASARAEKSRHTFQYVEGDACGVEGISDRSFDMVFSNSVIEHVGDFGRQMAFAHEVRRLGRSYWVQTPSIWFPIEAHTGMPFWWAYPVVLQRYFINRWRKKLPAWTDMVEATTVLRKSDMEKLFPDAQIMVERMFGIPKSYVAFSAERVRT